jgi:hypothetical protein
MHRNELDVLPVQRAVATASPSFWRDLLVVACSEGRIDAIDLDGALLTFRTPAALTVGEPIAMHPIAEIVAVGAQHFSARPVTSAE